jgi:hypothetical protein
MSDEVKAEQTDAAETYDTADAYSGSILVYPSSDHVSTFNAAL